MWRESSLRGRTGTTRRCPRRCESSSRPRSLLSASDRRIVLALVGESADPLLSRLLHAVATEVRHDQLVEDEMVRRLDAEHRAHVEEVARDAVWPNGTPTWAEVSGPPVDDPPADRDTDRDQP